MANIIERELGSEGSNTQGLSLQSEAAARAHGIPNDWVKLRIGIRAGIYGPSSTNLTGTPTFALGLCSGVTNIYPHASCAHAFGIQVNDLTWSDTAGSSSSSGRQYYNVISATANTILSCVDGSASFLAASNITSGHWYPAHQQSDGAQEPYASCMFLEFEKTAQTGNLGTEFSFTSCRAYGNGISSVVHTSHILFQQLMQAPDLASVASAIINVTMDTDVTTALAIDEVTDGELDSVFVAWRAASFPNHNLEVYDFDVARIE